MNWLILLNLIVRGLLFGGFISLAACGLSLGFEMGFINAAHGDTAVLAAYVSYFLLVTYGLDPLISLIFVLPVMFIGGITLQKFLLNRFLLRGDVDALLITTFSLGSIIRNALQLIFTANSRSLALPYLMGGFSLYGVLSVPISYLMDFVFALTIFTILHILFTKTFTGRAFRALAQDREAAMMFGVKPTIIYMCGMGIMVVTEAIFGVLMGITYVFTPASGAAYLLLPFSAIMIAGLGSLKRTFIGGLIMGEIILLSGFFFGSQYQYIICYLMTLLIIFLKPQGLLVRRA